jgi:hypothetical protein
MGSTETLTSLAMLKVNIDRGKDYLDYLRPFILQVLFDNKPDPVTDEAVHSYLRTQFGLEIPAHTVQLVLKRLLRALLLRREAGAYHIAGVLSDPCIASEKAKANRHIEAVVSGLVQFGKDGRQSVVGDEDEAVTALCDFLSEFSIQCLRAYLRGTTIPTAEGNRNKQADIILVSDYVLHLQRSEPERFDSFMILLQGHMLANALLCPDLQNAPKTYKGVTFYLDTPLLVQLLGLEGELKKRAIEEWTGLVAKLGGVIAVFSHCRDELDGVLRGAADHVDATNGYGAIIREARRNGTTKSDLLLLAGKTNELLSEAKVEVRDTPSYIATYQIDEKVFEDVLKDEVSYLNPRAREYDINSVRSIYSLRANMAPDSVERCKAVLVTSNAAFSQAAYKYGQSYEETRGVSSVITDFSLANIAWLKVPMGAPSIPRKELLAYSYAALQPSRAFLDKYMVEVDKLQKKGKITERDHQLLRSSATAPEELMQLTLGSETALTAELVSETLVRITNEIKEEESQKTRQEQEGRRKTQEELDKVSLQRDRLQKRIYWRCRRNAQTCAWGASSVVFVLLLLGVAAGLGLRAQNPLAGWLLSIGSALLAVISLLSLVSGTTLKRWHESIQAKCLVHFLRKESKAAGIDVGVDE